MRFAAPLLAALLAACSGAPAAAPAPDTAPQAITLPTTGPRRVEVLFLGHEATHHNSGAYAPILATALAREGINISYTTNPNDLNAANLAKYDAVLLYANHDSITPAQERALLEYVESGKGFVPIHSASHSFRNSARVMALMGGQFDRHGTGTFTAQTVRPDHPIMQGLQPFETWDETYVHKNNNPDRIVLQERVDENGREAWTWVRTQGQGRVFYTAYGHDQRTWNQPAFQQLVRNGILWAVGDRVRQQWSQLSLPALTYRASSNIPNYERRNPPPRFQEPLSPDASMKHIVLPPGFRLELFAAEPDIVKPIALAWDERGRLWIAETIDYPNDIHPGRPGRDRIKILEDTNGDGRADKFTVFADGLNIPTSLVFANGGLIVSQQPDLLFFKDTNGDDRADVKQTLVTGFGIRDTHAGPSNLRYGFDNRVWGAVGYSGYAGITNGDSIRFSQAIWSMKPDGTSMQHEANFSNNTWGLGFSETFDIFGSTANNTHAVYVGIPQRFVNGVRGLPVRAGAQKIDGHYGMVSLTPNVRQVDVFGGFTAAAGFNLYTARSFPREYWNRIALVNEPTGGVVHKAVLEKQGAGFVEKDGWNLLGAVDEWVGPVDAQVGPDGAVWVADWYNFIIQHNPTPAGFLNGEGNAYENALRDKTHGRIYRIVYTGGTPSTQPSLSKDRPAELVQALTNDNLFWRLTAQRLLVERGQRDVAPELYRLARSRAVDAMGMNAGALHAIWTLEGLGMMDGSVPAATAVAVAALRHPAAGVRKAALQVLPETRQTLDAAQAAGMLQDPDPHTRLAAILLVSRMPANDELGAMLYQLGKAPDVQNDEWLSQAVIASAAQHRAGYLKAYAAEMGDQPYRALAQRFAQEISNPPPPQPQGQQGQQGQQAARPAPPAPVAERLLRAYVEDVVGPIARPTMPPGGGGGGGGGAPSAEPVLAMEMSVIPGQMKFALPRFTAKPGQRVRITFTNPDDMQHNMLMLRPGTLEAVGALADAMAATPDGAERNYVPPTPDVMAFTPLVDPGKSFTLEFTAPRQPADYPYVCTFPGHWRVMQGVMTVAP